MHEIWTDWCNWSVWMLLAWSRCASTASYHASYLHRYRFPQALLQFFLICNHEGELATRDRCVWAELFLDNILHFFEAYVTGLREPYGHISTLVWDFLRMCLGFSQRVNASFSHIPASDYISIGMRNFVLNAKEVVAIYVTNIIIMNCVEER